MKITNVRVYKFKKEGSNLKGFANITIDDCLVVNDIKIMDGQKGLFIAFPSKKGNDDKYNDIVFPITKEAREAITNRIIKEYEETV